MRSNVSTWGWPAAMIALFAGALLIRLANLDQSPYGDEAYYYFITHDLRAYWDTSAFPVSGSTFPVFPLVYHFFAGNLLSLRAANALVGAATVPIAVLLMLELGTGRLIAIGGGVFLALDTILIQFSGLAFLDMLGAAIGLLAVFAYVKGRLAVAAILVALAVIEKEYYAILGLALAADHLIRRRRLYVELMVAAVPVLIWVIVRYGFLRAPATYLISGHAHAALTATGVDHAIGSIALLPLAAASVVLSDRMRAAALYVVLFLAFQGIWGNAQGWYWCLSVILATVLAADGAARLVKGNPTRRWVIGVVAGLAVVAFAAQAYTTTRYLFTWHGQDLDRVAAFLDGQPAQPITLVSCDWAYRYYPLGAADRPASSTDGWDAVATTLAVGCPGSPPAPTGWALRYRSGDYVVVSR